MNKIKNELREIVKVVECPYCGDVKADAHGLGCCGESSAHYQESYRYTDDNSDADASDVKAWKAERKGAPHGN